MPSLVLQELKSQQVDFDIREALANAISARCKCQSEFFDSINVGEFSCVTAKDQAIFWSTINGESNIYTATELLEFIQDWIDKDGKFTSNQIRMQMSKICSPLHLQSQPECSDEVSKPTRGDRDPPTHTNSTLKGTHS